MHYLFLFLLLFLTSTRQSRAQSPSFALVLDPKSPIGLSPFSQESWEQDANKPMYFFVPSSLYGDSIEMVWRIDKLNKEQRRSYKLQRLSELLPSLPKGTQYKQIQALSRYYSAFVFFPKDIDIRKQEDKEWLAFCDTLFSGSWGFSHELSAKCNRSKGFERGLLFSQTGQHPYQSIFDAIKDFERIELELAQLKKGQEALLKYDDNCAQQIESAQVLHNFTKKQEYKQRSMLGARILSQGLMQNFLQADEHYEAICIRILSEPEAKKQLPEAERSRDQCRRVLESTPSTRQYLRLVDELRQIERLRKQQKEELEDLIAHCEYLKASRKRIKEAYTRLEKEYKEVAKILGLPLSLPK